MSYRHHELSLPDRVPHELHGSGVGSAGEDESVRALGRGDQTLLERLLFPAVHLEVLGTADQGDGQVRPVGLEQAPVLDQEGLDQLDRGLVRQAEVSGEIIVIRKYPCLLYTSPSPRD